MDLTDAFDPVEDAIRAIAAGQPVLVTDDENRENEADLIAAASKATPEIINMMIRDGSGVVCVPMMEWQLKRLGINQMVPYNAERHRTDYTVSVDAAEGVTTGISAADRARTTQLLGDAKTTAEQLVQPGHIFPIRAKPGGVLERAGHTEAAVDLATLAGLHPSAAICELANPDGSMSRLPEVVAYKEKHQLKLISIAQLIEYRHQREPLVEEIHSEVVETPHGAFKLHVFRNILDNRHNYALSRGELNDEPTLVRVHSENIIHDVFSAGLPGRSSVLDAALAAIAKEGKGVLVYMTHPCGGLDLAVSPQKGSCQLEPMRMDFRSYGLGAQILRGLGLRQIRLLSTSPRNIVALDGYGLEIIEQGTLNG